MIQGIQVLQNAPVSTNKLDSITNVPSDSSFTDSLEAAKKLLNATNEAEAVTGQLTYDFMTGKTDNIHTLKIAQEKSTILLNFTMQVRNQLLDAYKEIMRLSI